MGQHGLPYHGPAPSWAVWFWDALCGVDFVIQVLSLAWPRAGLAMTAATMAVNLAVN